MLSFRIHRRVFRRLSLLLLLALCVTKGALAQDAMKLVDSRVANLLRVGRNDRDANLTSITPANAQPFDFSDKLIRFTATVDGRHGSFILDTGAPEVLINNHGHASRGSAPMGIGAGGEVALADHYIESFVLSGREHRKMWAYSVDLRPLERRLGREVDGFVGYNLLSESELRIDYRKGVFELLASTRQPRFEGAAPTHSIPFKLVGHLPVITIKVGGQKLRLALDTGASVNLLDASNEAIATLTGRRINVQGLDGRPAVVKLVTLPSENTLPATGAPIEFAVWDLAEKRDATGYGKLDGLLGSEFLANFVVGIDYRRRRLYLWSPTISK